MSKRKPLNLRLKKLMNEKNVSVEELAEAINATEGEIIDWRNKKRDPSTRRILQLARFFNCSTDYLLGYSNSRQETIDEDDNDEKEESTENGSRLGYLALIFFAVAAGAYALYLLFS